MGEDSVKQTLAWRIVRPLVDHVYGSDEKMSSDDFLTVYRAFAGGLGAALLAGAFGSGAGARSTGALLVSSQ